MCQQKLVSNLNVRNFIIAQFFTTEIYSSIERNTKMGKGRIGEKENVKVEWRIFRTNEIDLKINRPKTIRQNGNAVLLLQPESVTCRILIFIFELLESLNFALNVLEISIKLKQSNRSSLFCVWCAHSVTTTTTLRELHR